MYDIAKTRMLLTTAVFAAVAAVLAGGVNARIPDEDGSGTEGRVSIVGVVGAQAPSWRGKGGKGEETAGGLLLGSTGSLTRAWPTIASTSASISHTGASNWCGQRGSFQESGFVSREEDGAPERPVARHLRGSRCS